MKESCGGITQNMEDVLKKCLCSSTRIAHPAIDHHHHAMIPSHQTNQNMNTTTEEASSQDQGLRGSKIQDMVKDSNVGTASSKMNDTSRKTQIVGGMVSSSDSNLRDDEQESVSTLFPDCDRDDDSFSSSETVPLDLKELEKEFKIRDHLLDQLVKEIDPFYAGIMRENEEAVRKQKMLHLKEKIRKHEEKRDHQQKKQEDGNVSNVPITDAKNRDEAVPPPVSNVLITDAQNRNETVPPPNQASTSWMQRLHRAIVFEVQNVLPGVISLILNCIAFNACLEILEIVISRLSSIDYERQHFLPFVLLIGSVVVLRITGGIFDWVGDAVYGRVKFDMHNRLRLGKSDAKLVRWFHHHEHIRTFLNVFAFFACSFAVNQLQDQALGMAFDKREELFANLPSVKNGIFTSVSRRVAAGLSKDSVERLLAESTCEAGVCSFAESDDWTRRDEAFVRSAISEDCYGELMGIESAVLVTEWVAFWFSIVTSLVAIVLLKMMGIHFWTM